MNQLEEELGIQLCAPHRKVELTHEGRRVSLGAKSSLDSLEPGDSGYQKPGSCARYADRLLTPVDRPVLAGTGAPRTLHFVAIRRYRFTVPTGNDNVNMQRKRVSIWRSISTICLHRKLTHHYLMDEAPYRFARRTMPGSISSSNIPTSATLHPAAMHDRQARSK